MYKKGDIVRYRTIDDKIVRAILKSGLTTNINGLDGYKAVTLDDNKRYFLDKNRIIIVKKKEIWLPIYNGKLVIIGGNDYRNIAKKYAVDMTSNNFEAVSYAILDKDGSYNFVVFFTMQTIDIDIIAHEASHLVNKIFKTHSVKYSKDNDEHFAYLLGWITKKCYDFLETIYNK
jgi:hypothetical protein